MHDRSRRGGRGSDDVISAVVARETVAIRLCESRSLLGEPSAGGSRGRLQVEATWLSRVGASLLLQGGLQGIEFA